MPFDLRPSVNDTQDHLCEEDVLVGRVVPKKLVEIDKELFASKWWDYRFMTPMEATLDYVDCFAVEARKVYAREYDYERAGFIHFASAEGTLRKIREADPIAKRYFTGYWRGRQVADALGMPYGTFINEAMTTRMRWWSGNYYSKGKMRTAVLPKPWQLYTDWLVEKVAARWDEIQASRIFYAAEANYHAGNFNGFPAQVAYVEHLMTRARATHDYHRTLGTMISNDYLPYEEVMRRLDDERDRERVRASLS